MCYFIKKNVEKKNKKTFSFTCRNFADTIKLEFGQEFKKVCFATVLNFFVRYIFLNFTLTGLNCQTLTSVSEKRNVNFLQNREHPKDGQFSFTYLFFTYLF